MSEDKFKQIEKRIASIEKSQKTIVALEQYKILFSVIVNLGDNVVKGVLSMLVIYFAVVAFVVQGVNNNPDLKNVLFVNYGLIFIFFYYLAYLRFRIVTMFELAEEIEKKAEFPYKGIHNYESKTNYRFFSTKGLYLILVSALIIINTAIYFIL